MNSKKYTLFLYLFLVFCLGACATGKQQILVSDEAELYFKEGQNYTYAIYNSDNLLISHPLEAWSKASKDAQSHGEPYTDLYIISHGWNFTHQEAIVNFQQYMKIWDKKTYDGFRPYIIFVVWNSTSRPITDSVGAVLPFGLDKGVDPFTKLADVGIHTITGWKQSLNAERIALGRDLPFEYEVKKYSKIKIDEKNDIGGKDIPLSMVLYEIVNTNNNEIIKEYNKTLTESKPDVCKPQCNKKPTKSKPVTFKPQKIHLVGHSYGAKLISLASLEALRRLYPDKTNKSSEADKDSKKTSPPPATTFESLVLLNAAYNAHELNYYHNIKLKWYGLTHFPITEENIYSLWTHIPRKALVYSNTDLATGILYDTGQIVFNTYSGQYQDAIAKYWGFRTDGHYVYVVDDVLMLLNGVFSLVYNLTISPIIWVGTTLAQIPTDFYHHIVNNDTFHSTFGDGVFSKMLNVPHFFLPLDKLNSFWGGDDNFSDHQGLWRSSTPAIGRTGLHRLGWWDSGAFGLFVGNDEEKGESSNIDARQFNSIACSLKNLKDEPRIFDNEKLFYSFDGSQIYDSWFSHGDLRSKHPAKKACGKKNDEDKNIIEKREATFNFITKFTTLGENYPYDK
jgi:hypothetical protein